MPEANVRQLRTRPFWLAAALVLAVPIGMAAQAGQGAPAPGGQGRGAGAPGGQGRGGGAPGAQPGGGAPGARGAAPVDLTGYWVSIVTEDWIERMSPDSPPSGTGGGGGGFGGGRGGGGRGGRGAAPAANTDPCRAFAAGGSMRMPGRLNITWADDNTLKIDMDAGTQTRLLHFNATGPAPAQKSLQGYSVATWDTGRGGGGGGGGGGRGGGGGGARGGGGGGSATPRWGSLRVVTTNLTGGYLLSSRGNYTDNATVTEYFTRHADFGTEYFTVTVAIDDPGNPLAPPTTSSTFKKEPNGSKFSPSACEPVK